MKLSEKITLLFKQARREAVRHYKKRDTISVSFFVLLPHKNYCRVSKLFQ